jgi:hypothetical protein
MHVKSQLQILSSSEHWSRIRVVHGGSISDSCAFMHHHHRLRLEVINLISCPSAEADGSGGNEEPE